MKNKLLRYDDFRIDESISLLLEAKIQFSDEFTEILDKIDTVTADKLINLIGKDIDVNTNYIDIDIEKDGFVKFIPDDKAEKAPFTVQTFPTYYVNLSKDLGLKNVDHNSTLTRGMKVDLVKKYSKDEFLREVDKIKDVHGGISDFINHVYSNNNNICKVAFEKDGVEKELLCSSGSIKKDVNKIKPSNIKIGKLATALFKKAGIEFKPTDIEDFVNRYKSIIKQIRDKFDNFKIFKGEDIRKNYLFDNYLNDNGSLGNSCMRYPRCQEYLDIYVRNEDQVSLIVLMSDDKVTGRAILWTDTKDRKIMDRIYTNNSADERLFIDFAKANGFWYKEKQDMYSDTPFIGPNDEEEKYIIVQLKDNYDYNYYPYMDSMKFYGVSSGRITNNNSLGYDYELTDTEGGNGSCDECGGSGTLSCDDCDGDGEVECGYCDGSGQIECGDCDGDGEVECSTCDGEGKEECDYCDGHGENDCSNCDGSGKVEGDDGEEEDCEDCSGTGKEECEHCDGNGNLDCPNCEGTGERRCNNCYGEGSYECDYCDGNGNVECSNCDGDGNVDCYQCS